MLKQLSQLLLLLVVTGIAPYLAALMFPLKVPAARRVQQRAGAYIGVLATIIGAGIIGLSVFAAELNDVWRACGQQLADDPDGPLVHGVLTFLIVLSGFWGLLAALRLTSAPAIQASDNCSRRLHSFNPLTPVVTANIMRWAALLQVLSLPIVLLQVFSIANISCPIPTP